MSYEMNDLLELVVDQKSSDLHLQVGVPPCLRLRGSMTPIDGPELRPEDTEQLMLSITPDNHQQKTCCVQTCPIRSSACNFLSEVVCLGGSVQLRF